MRHLDLIVFHLVNGWCGTPLIDRIAAFEEGGNLLRGGLLLIPYWWFWFSADGQRRDQQRRVIVGALLGTLGALIVARGLAAALPFRLRPMHDSGLGFHAPSLPIAMNMESWSSFPSDTATLFFALSFGVLRLSRRLGTALTAYSAAWICLPRIYLGIHYPSDILAGALLGVALVWATIWTLEARDGALGRRAVAWVSATEARRPGLFYAAAFTLSFALATMFDDIRAVGRAGARWLHHGGGLEIAAVVILAGGALVAFPAIAMLRRRRPQDRAGASLRAS
ncbi:MAG: phosphatase PAP2 family protein [Acetobacteraceae bacterium]|nr:phosphatase PAP2 family protein [Acetobacteraceae bacterium]